MKKSKYYSLKNILSKNCTYSIIIGERSNGKTYAYQSTFPRDEGVPRSELKRKT